MTLTLTLTAVPILVSITRHDYMIVALFVFCVLHVRVCVHVSLC